MNKIAREVSFFLSIPAILWQVLFLLVPLVITFLISFLGESSTGYFVTTSNYTAIFSMTHLSILMRSLLLATGTALVALVIGYPLAYYVAVYTGRLRPLYLFFLMLPFWTNLLILAYAWFFLVEKEGVINTVLLWLGIISKPLILAHNMGAVLIVMVYCYLPFMILPIYSALEKIDKRLWEAAADLGARPAVIFRRITFPLTIDGIRTGILLVFVPAFGEFAIPMLLGGDKTLVVGSLIAHYFFIAYDTGKGAALTVITGAFLLFIVVIIVAILQKNRRVVLPQRSAHE